MGRAVGFLLAVLLGLFSVSAKELAVSATCDFLLPAYMSEAEGREIAVSKARLQALADEFGTILSQETWSEMRTDNSSVSSQSLWQSASSLVKGEWIRDTREPMIKKSLTADGSTFLTVTVWGMARPVTTLPVDLKTFVSLPGGGIPVERFRHDSRFTLNFLSPENGYVAVYLADEEGNVSRLLPFSNEEVSSFGVDAMKQYEFFTSQEGVEEQYRFLTNQPKVFNTVFVVFARNEFTRPIDSYDETSNIRVLKKADFFDWVARLRSADRTVQIESLNVEIVRK